MNLSEMYKEFDDLMRRHNEYVVYEKPLAEMNNGKIVSGSKYIVIAPTAVLDKLEKEVAALEKTQTKVIQTMLLQLAVVDCVLHRLSLYQSRILNIRIQRQLKSVLICFIEFITKVRRKR